MEHIIGATHFLFVSLGIRIIGRQKGLVTHTLLIKGWDAVRLLGRKSARLLKQRKGTVTHILLAIG